VQVKRQAQNPRDGGAAGTGRRHEIVRRGRSTRLRAFGYRARRNWIWVTSVRCGAILSGSTNGSGSASGPNESPARCSNRTDRYLRGLVRTEHELFLTEKVALSRCVAGGAQPARLLVDEGDDLPELDRDLDSEHRRIVVVEEGSRAPDRPVLHTPGMASPSTSSRADRRVDERLFGRLITLSAFPPSWASTAR
jgi:hypothetical protein